MLIKFIFVLFGTNVVILYQLVQIKITFMPRIEKFDKEKALNKALNLFWEKGYEATSLTDLTNIMGIGKGSFYNTFKSKRSIFEHCLTIYKTISIESLMELLNSEKSIHNGVEKFLIFNLNSVLDDPKRRGCFLTNTCTELAVADQSVKESIGAHYQKMREILIAYLSKQGKLALKDASLKADIIMTFFIGLTVQLKLQIDKTQITSSIDKLLQSLLLPNLK